MHGVENLQTGQIIAIFPNFPEAVEYAANILTYAEWDIVLLDIIAQQVPMGDVIPMAEVC